MSPSCPSTKNAAWAIPQRAPPCHGAWARPTKAPGEHALGRAGSFPACGHDLPLLLCRPAPWHQRAQDRSKAVPIQVRIYSHTWHNSVPQSIKPPAEEHFPLSCQPDCSRWSKVADDSAARSTLSCQWVDVNSQRSKRGGTLRYEPGWTFRTGFSCFRPIYRAWSGIFIKLSEIAQKRKKKILFAYI